MSPQRSKGFTLLELLVVMVIIAVIASVAVISTGALGRDPPAQKAAHELADLAGLASEQAVMQGRVYGLRIEAHGYSFYTYDGRKWAPLQADNLFYRRDLGDDVTLTLHMDGTTAALAPPPATVEEPAAATSATSAGHEGDTDQTELPQVLLLSSGELLPFEIEVAGVSGAAYTVKGSLTDGITVVEPAADAGKARP